MLFFGGPLPPGAMTAVWGGGSGGWGSHPDRFFCKAGGQRGGGGRGGARKVRAGFCGAVSGVGRWRESPPMGGHCAHSILSPHSATAQWAD